MGSLVPGNFTSPSYITCGFCLFVICVGVFCLFLFFFLNKIVSKSPVKNKLALLGLSAFFMHENVSLMMFIDPVIMLW